jgi:Flp pilus assembly protein TadG
LALKFLKFTHSRRESGQSVVEFALVMPIFVILLFGIIEFGRLWMTVNVMTGAAREGARVAAIYGTSSGQARTAAQNVLSAGHVSGAIIAVSGPNASGEVVVSVSLTYSTLTGAIIPGLANSMQLSQSATMRWEG